MYVLSLFNGMNCGYIALDRLGVKPTRYYSSEIDQHAIKIANKNYPDTIQLGDVKNWRDWDIEWKFVDLILSGFPCQAWSVAGQQQGDRDPRGQLFWVMLDIMKHVMECNPNAKYLMENVRMSNAFEKYITHHTEQALPNVNKYLINSSLVSAQNRKRFYWTNIEGVEQPKDRGIVLKDILEDGLTDRTKSHCLDANYFKGGNLKSYFEKHRRQLVFSPNGMCHVGDADLNGNQSIKRVYHEDGKAPTLTTMGGGHREPKVLVKGARMVGRRLDASGTRKDNDKSIPIKQMIEVRDDDKTNCLTTVTKDSILVENMSWRKLSCLECERLQTVPDGYTEGVSNTQRYKMLGNGWTVDVIAHILKGL
jgi:DNA (cytosine-5)-methyltransferase 1/DNA (cytosine-5)-methyltransferase 3A